MVLPIEKINSLTEEIQLVPIIVQEYIDKSYELRVSVVKGQVFASKINSQTLEAAKIDWRTSQGVDGMFEPYKLEKIVEEMLIKYTKTIGLDFGAFDLIRTPDGEIVFLECNPDGQWLFLDKITAKNISNAMHSHIKNLLHLECA